MTASDLLFDSGVVFGVKLSQKDIKDDAMAKIIGTKIAINGFV